MSIVIEKNVVMPQRGELTKVLRGMEIGDSFLYPVSSRTTVRPIAVHAGIKIATRKVSNTEIRVWRVA